MSNNQVFIPSKKSVCEECFTNLHHWHDMPGGEKVKFLAICPISSHELINDTRLIDPSLIHVAAKTTHKVEKCECQYHGNWGADHHPMSI